MKNIPFLLIYSRILIAIVIVSLLFFSVPDVETTIVVLLITGVLTDVLDGVIARKLKVSSEKLRVLDSNVDQFFWITIIATIFYVNPNFIQYNYAYVLTILFLEIIAYLLSYIRFKRTIATHSLLAKFWVLTLLAFLVDLVLHSDSTKVFAFCILIGIISRVEIIAIMLTLKKWTTDVPSIIAVSKLNRGQTVKKSSWLNS